MRYRHTRRETSRQAAMTHIHLINIYTSDEAPQTTNEATHTEHKIRVFRNKTPPSLQRFYALFITYVISALNNMQKRTFFLIICIFLPSANRETAVCNQVSFNTKRRSRFPQAHNSGTLKDYCIYIVFRITDYQTRQRIMKKRLHLSAMRSHTGGGRLAAGRKCQVRRHYRERSRQQSQGDRMGQPDRRRRRIRHWRRQLGQLLTSVCKKW